MKFQSISLGSAVHSIRKANNETLRQMAKKLGCSHVQVYNIENDRIALSPRILEKIKEVYGVDPYLMSFEPRIEFARKLLQEWQDQQGHNRCWYYPEIFDAICIVLGVMNKRPHNLPPLKEFENGCKRYQLEQYS